MIPRHVQIAVVMLLVGVFAGGFYLLHLKGQAEEHARRAADNRPLAPPVSGTPEKVDLFIAYDEDGVVRRREASVPLPVEPNLRARELLRALVGEYLKQPSPHPLGDGADIRDVYFVGDLAVVDLNAAFAETHRSGVLTEELTLISLVQTLSANVPGIARVKVLVDGRERETLAGHADLLSFYDVYAVDKLVKEMH